MSVEALNTASLTRHNITAIGYSAVRAPIISECVLHTAACAPKEPELMRHIEEGATGLVGLPPHSISPHMSQRSYDLT